MLTVGEMSTRILRLLSEFSDIYAAAFEEINRLTKEDEHSSSTGRGLGADPQGTPPSRTIKAITDDIIETYKSELSDVYQAALDEIQRLRGERNSNRTNLTETREKYALEREELSRMRGELAEKKTSLPADAEEREFHPYMPERNRLNEQLEALRDRRWISDEVSVCWSCGNGVRPRDLFCDSCGSFLIGIRFR